MKNNLLDKKVVFISYSHKDISEEWIEKFVTVLEQFEIEVIIDINNLHLGQDINYGLSSFIVGKTEFYY